MSSHTYTVIPKSTCSLREVQSNSIFGVISQSHQIKFLNTGRGIHTGLKCVTYSWLTDQDTMIAAGELRLPSGEVKKTYTKMKRVESFARAHRMKRMSTRHTAKLPEDAEGANSPANSLTSR
jgi:hypothetical protein